MNVHPFKQDGSGSGDPAQQMKPSKSASGLLAGLSGPVSSAPSYKAKAAITGKSGNSYILLEKLGKGGYGTVYKGLWAQEGRHVAIKRVSRVKLSDEENKAIQSEVTLLRNLKNKHIVNYIEAVESDDMYLDIVMEYIEGGSLEKLVTEVRKSTSSDSLLVLDEHLVCKFVRQILLGLSYLHAQGVVHRDIKGANILITKESQVKLTDFGVSSTKPADVNSNSSSSNNDNSDIFSSSSSTGDMEVVGTPYWMAPEIISLFGFSTASDIWSVGCTIIELLTGFPPYHDLNELSAMFRIVSDDRPPLPPNISPDLEDFLLKCFNKDMHTRASADELLTHRWIQQGAAREKETLSLSKLSTSLSIGGAGVDLNRMQSSPPIRSKSTSLTGSLNPGDITAYKEDKEIEYDDLDLEFESDLILETGKTLAVQPAEELSASDPFDDASFHDPVAERERERMRLIKEKWERIKFHMQRLIEPYPSLVCSSAASVVQIIRDFPEQKSNLMINPGLIIVLEMLFAAESKPKGLNSSTAQVVVAGLSIIDEMIAEHPDSNAGMPRTTSQSGTMSPSSSSSGLLQAVQSIDDGIMINMAELRMQVCLTGFLPLIIKFCGSEYDISVRALASQIISKLCSEVSAQYMFLASGGIAALISLLEPDLDKYYQISKVAIETVWLCLDMSVQKYRTSTLRRLAITGIVKCLGQSISWFLCDTERLKRYPEHLKSLASLLQVLAERPDFTIKNRLADVSLLIPMEALFADMQQVPSEIIVFLLCAVKDLSRDPATHQPLMKSGVIVRMVKMLSEQESMLKMQQPIIVTIYNVSMVSPQRQEAIVLAGIVPHLMALIRINDINLKGYAIEIYSGLASSSSKAREELWKNDGLRFYLDLLVAQGLLRKWQAKILGSVSDWLIHDRTKVETVLIEPENQNTIVRLFQSWPVNQVELLLEPYRQMVSLSVGYSIAMENSGILQLIIAWLQNIEKPAVRVTTLRILILHFHNSKDRKSLAKSTDLVRSLIPLVGNQSAVTVGDLILQLLAMVITQDELQAIVEKAQDVPAHNRADDDEFFEEDQVVNEENEEKVSNYSDWSE